MKQKLYTAFMLFMVILQTFNLTVNFYVKYFYRWTWFLWDSLWLIFLIVVAAKNLAVIRKKGNK